MPAWRIRRNENVSVGTTPTALLDVNPRRRMVVVTNGTANRCTLSWDDPNVADGLGVAVLNQYDSMVELYEPQAGGIGEALYRPLYGVKVTGAQNVRVVEFEYA